MSGNTPFIVQTNTQAKGFSLAEVLIVVACVIVIAVLCLQVLKKIIPDREARMFKKAYNLTTRLVPSMVQMRICIRKLTARMLLSFLAILNGLFMKAKNMRVQQSFVDFLPPN